MGRNWIKGLVPDIPLTKEVNPPSWVSFENKVIGLLPYKLEYFHTKTRLVQTLLVMLFLMQNSSILKNSPWQLNNLFYL